MVRLPDGLCLYSLALVRELEEGCRFLMATVEQLTSGNGSIGGLSRLKNGQRRTRRGGSAPR